MSTKKVPLAFHRKGTANSGLSLIELVVTLAILSIVMIFLNNFISSLFDQQLTAQKINDSRNSTIGLLKAIESRMMRAIPGTLKTGQCKQNMGIEFCRELRFEYANTHTGGVASFQTRTSCEAVTRPGLKAMLGKADTTPLSMHCMPITCPTGTVPVMKISINNKTRLFPNLKKRSNSLGAGLCIAKKGEIIQLDGFNFILQSNAKIIPYQRTKFINTASSFTKEVMVFK